LKILRQVYGAQDRVQAATFGFGFVTCSQSLFFFIG